MVISFPLILLLIYLKNSAPIDQPADRVHLKHTRKYSFGLVKQKLNKYIDDKIKIGITKRSCKGKENESRCACAKTNLANVCTVLIGTQFSS